MYDELDDEEYQEQTKKDLGLYVDLREFMVPNSSLQYSGLYKRQQLDVPTLDVENKIRIIVPDKSFKWLFEVIDTNFSSLFLKEMNSDYDNFDDQKKKLHNDIAWILSIVTKKQTRLFYANQHPHFQFYDGREWLDLVK